MLSVEQLARRVGAVRAHCRQQQQQQRCELACVTVSMHAGLHTATGSIAVRWRATPHHCRLQLIILLLCSVALLHCHWRSPAAALLVLLLLLCVEFIHELLAHDKVICEVC